MKDITVSADTGNGGPSTSKSRHSYALVATVVLLFAWLAVNAIWGLTSTEQTMIAGWLARVTNLGTWVGVLVVAIATTLGYAAYQREHSLAGLSLILLAYVGGVAAGELLRDVAQAGLLTELTGWTVVLADRAFLLVPVFPMLLAAWFVGRSLTTFRLRFGRWRGATGSWRLRLVLWMLVVFLPLAFVMQASVNFMPIKSGNLWPAMLPLTLLALLNALGEELVFRGLLLPSLTSLLRPNTALWLQGLFFGLHHWGSSPDPVSGLPMAIVLTVVGYIWGRSVLQTGGLGWAILTHMSLDCALMWAHFVPSA